MPKPSAGLLMFRRCGAAPEVLLVHPGGPFWGTQGRWSMDDSQGRDRAWRGPARRSTARVHSETGFGHPWGGRRTSRKSARPAASRSPRSPLRVIVTPRSCKATLSRWSGRQTRGSAAGFSRGRPRGVVPARPGAAQAGLGPGRVRPGAVGSACAAGYSGARTTFRDWSGRRPHLLIELHRARDREPGSFNPSLTNYCIPLRSAGPCDPGQSVSRREARAGLPRSHRPSPRVVIAELMRAVGGKREQF